MLCPFLTRAASKVWKMPVCHGLHPTEQHLGKLEARAFPGNLGTTMMCEDIRITTCNSLFPRRPPRLSCLWFFWMLARHHWLFSNASQQPMACDSPETEGAARGSSIPWSHLGRGWQPQALRSGPGVKRRFGVGPTGEALRAANALRALTLSPAVSRTTCAWDSLSFPPVCITTCFYPSFHFSVPPRRHLEPGAAGGPLQHNHCANLSSFTMHLTLCTEPGSFSDSISLWHVGRRLLGQEWKIPQLPKGQKLQFFSMQVFCNSVLLLGVIFVPESKR